MSADLLEDLRRAVEAYDGRQIKNLAENAIERGIHPAEALDALTEAVREVGNRFNDGELWLPDLIRAAEAFKIGMPIFVEEIAKRGERRRGLGVIVIGTVHGDIHNIGKDMVATLLTAEGFTVHDLGIDVPTSSFIDAIAKHKADLLAMSALLTMSSTEQKKIIDTLITEGIRDKVKVLVGGGAISQEFADSIGADGYAPTAPLACQLARSLVERL